MKKILATILILSIVIDSEARRRPRDRNEWDEIKEELVCVSDMRKFLQNHSNYLSGELSASPEISSITGVPRRKIKCDSRLVEDLGEGLAQCSTDPARNPYRFTGFGVDCPSKTISRLKISDEASLRIELYDKCDTQRTGDLFSEQEIIKVPSNISDEQIQTMANEKLKSAILDIYRKIDMAGAYEGLSRNRIEAIENQLGQNIFGKVNCSVRHFRDSEVGPVMRQAIDRVCGQKRTVLNRPERCMLNAPESYGVYSQPASAQPASEPAQTQAADDDETLSENQPDVDGDE